MSRPRLRGSWWSLSTAQRSPSAERRRNRLQILDHHLQAVTLSVVRLSTTGRRANRTSATGTKCGLTIRSTGPYRACRHLARHFLLGQVPSRCSGPVSSNVRRAAAVQRFHNSMNRWRIPDWLEREVIERDARCVYCGVEFRDGTATRRERPSWEHIINDASIVSLENIARCCIGCNASKGTKLLVDWLESEYCNRKGISPHSVAPVVRAAIRRFAGG